MVDFLKSHGVSGLRPATAPKQLAHSSFLEAIKATCPLPFQIGVDICDISRIQKLVQSSDTFYQRFRDRVLTPLEVELQFIPEIRLAEFLAGRWAAKEAIIKAKASWQADGGTKEKVFMHDIVILPGPIVEAISAADVQSGEFDVNDGISKDDVRQQRGPLRAFVRQNGKWKEVLVSVSHDGEMATAMAFVVKD